MDDFTVSVVIPNRNDGKLLKSLLTAINDQTFLPKEIVIIDSSTNDDAKDIIEEYDDSVMLTYHCEKKAYPGKARNVGVKLANGNWIAFLDS
ncbi:TPA: glycosyl transferase, partial [Candidatus Peribacteria bacterium]|nr:glycosyl transferase [Candidatus Peribacteria bacterium]